MLPAGRNERSRRYRAVLLLNIVLLLLAGCSATGRDPPIAAADLPMTEWAPPGPPGAVVLALHGFNDYRAGFAEFGRFLAANGILLRAYDQPGFGETPERGHWMGEERLIEALDRQITDLRARYPTTPLFVLGESMGGAVLALAASRADFPKVDGLILSSPAVWGGSSIKLGYRLLLNVLAELAPGWRLTGSSLKILASDDIPMLIGLGRDPLVIKGTRTDAIKGLVQLMDDAKVSAPFIAQHTLVLTGYRDQVIPPSAQIAFATKIASRSCRFIGYLDGWHLLLRDRQRVRVWLDILAWIHGRRPPSYLDHPCVTPQE